jgi:hypothetical protein
MKRRRPKDIVDGANGIARAVRKGRVVRLIVKTHVEEPNGRPLMASHAWVDLDERGVDRLVARLQRIRGGFSALKKSA